MEQQLGGPVHLQTHEHPVGRLTAEPLEEPADIGFVDPDEQS